MRTTRVLSASVFSVLLTFFLLPAAAHAANVTVGCGGISGTYDYTTIQAALDATIGNLNRVNIVVAGNCSESVSMFDRRSITIVGLGGASVFGPNDNDAFDIIRSQGITLENLDISSTGPDAAGLFINAGSNVRIVACNIHSNQSAGVQVGVSSVLFLQGTTIQNNTPNDGLDVYDNSTAVVSGSTIQDNGVPMSGSAGVLVTRNSVIRFQQTNSVQNNADVGIHARIQSTVVFAGADGEITTVQGNLTNGIMLEEGSHFQLNRFPNLIQGNGYGAACPLDPTCGGILATQDSHVDLVKTIVSGNQGFGVSVLQGSNVRLGGATVSGNTGDGVRIQWLSIAEFLSGNTITGNGGTSIFCAGRSFALGNLSTFSNVRCGDN